MNHYNHKRIAHTGIMLLLACGLSSPTFAEKDTDSFEYGFEEIQTNLVVLKCEGGGVSYTGCGFIVQMDEKPYLVTSQRTLLGAENIKFYSPTGRIIKPRSLELSASRDIIRLALADGEALEVAHQPEMGSRIGVFGSSSEQDQLSLYGIITGMGADIVEVSADFTAEHSGSPVLSESKEVIGIASFVRESSNHAMKKGTKFEDRTRHFCYRVENSDWKPVKWKPFNQKFGTVHREGNMFIDSVVEILNSWADDPFEQVNFKESPERMLINWAVTHNKTVGGVGNKSSFDRKAYSEYSDSTRKLAEACRSKARKIRMISQQKGLTEFLLNEYDMQAATLEYFAKIIDRYTTLTDY